MSRIPRQIVLDLSSKCNLSCLYCPSTDKKSKIKPGFMDTELVYSVVNRIVEEKLNTSITCCLLGESLLHPDIYQIFSYIASSGVPFYVTTNSTINKMDVFELLTSKNSCYQLIFSNNGLFGRWSNSLETYMVGIDREKSKNIIDRVIQMRNNKKSNLEIGVKIIRRGQDQEELEHLIHFWLNYGGADFVAIGKVLIDTQQGSRIYPCRHSDDMAMYVRSDGTVIPCGWNTRITNGLEINFGKLEKTGSLVEFYNNEQFREFRKAHYEKKFPSICDKCTIAYTGDGTIGTVVFRSKKLSRRKMYYHDDYSNTFYSYKKRFTRVSFLRDWQPDNDSMKELK